MKPATSATDSARARSPRSIPAALTTSRTTTCRFVPLTCARTTCAPSAPASPLPPSQVEISGRKGQGPERLLRALLLNSQSILLFGGGFDGLGCGDGPVGRAHLEARKAPHGNDLAQLAYLLRDQLLDADGLVLDEGLLQQANLLVELGHLAIYDLLYHRGRLAGGGGLRAEDILLAVEIGRGHVLGLHIARVAGRDVHRDVLEQLLEVLGAGHEVALAIQFEQYADLAAGVNIGAHRALVGRAGGLLLRRGHAPLAQHHKGILDISLGLLQRLQAVAHRRAGLLAQLLYQLCINLFAHCFFSLFLVISGQLSVVSSQWPVWFRPVTAVTRLVVQKN